MRADGKCGGPQLLFGAVKYVKPVGYFLGTGKVNMRLAGRAKLLGGHDNDKDSKWRAGMD